MRHRQRTTAREDTMSLNYRQRRQLNRIEARLLRSDPQLAAMLTIFARLSAGQFMPAWEQLATTQNRIWRRAAFVAKTIAVIAAATRLLLGAVLGLLAAVVTGGRARPASRARQEARPDPGPDGRLGPDAAADR
jgi:hypothetical protein